MSSKYIYGAWYYIRRECDKGEWTLAIYIENGFYIVVGERKYFIDDVFEVGRML
jgi:hypothetical protein